MKMGRVTVAVVLENQFDLYEVSQGRLAPEGCRDSRRDKIIAEGDLRTNIRIRCRVGEQRCLPSNRNTLKQNSLAEAMPSTTPSCAELRVKPQGPVHGNRHRDGGI